MKTSDSSIACAGMDVHYRFSNVTFRDQHGNVVSRQRLDHTDRQKLRRRLSQWPTGLPVVMEASFGWAWLSDMMLELSLEPHLSNCFKVEQMRKARGLVKTNKKDSDLSSLLPFEPSNWWEVYLASPAVRDRREWRHLLRFLQSLRQQGSGVSLRIVSGWLSVFIGGLVGDPSRTGEAAGSSSQAVGPGHVDVEGIAGEKSAGDAYKKHPRVWSDPLSRVDRRDWRAFTVWRAKGVGVVQPAGAAIE